jgi:sec-independent protein translocase protein TatA
MGGLSWVHILLIAVVVLVLFGGRGKLSDIMGDFAKGIKSFKKGMSDEDTPPPTIEHRDEHKDGAAH